MEVIIGVIIGAVIGYVAAITTLVVEHRRWRKEFKLHYLITERKRREEQCDRIRELLKQVLHDEAKGLSDEMGFEFGSFIGSRLPLKVVNLIQKALKEPDRSDEGGQKLYQEVSLILGTYLGEIDKQIEELAQ